MDIIGGLTAAKLAIDIAKDLRSIDRSLDEASFKLKLADLTSALADTQLALADAKVKVSELENQIKDLTDGTTCPVCRIGRLNIFSVQEHELSNFQFHKVRCTSATCEYSATRTYDPTRAMYSSKRE